MDYSRHCWVQLIDAATSWLHPIYRSYRDHGAGTSHQVERWQVRRQFRQRLVVGRVRVGLVSRSVILFIVTHIILKAVDTFGNYSK